MKHTPGPWEASQWRVCHSVGGDIGVICDTANNAKTRTEENMANAKLIAAAPELLEALEELYAVVRGESNWLLNEDSGGDAALDEKIRNAIEKATGEKHERRILL